mmetsp:Transcript_3930/g.8449  ORF Transcript_3930/g.8449 Transcript_3930/m.8449 type:complete len:608 (-) Transcript_3930:859-2682(-)|eukprot:CAMPEP_0168169848 /NCGR_PEP_ID=MMETSP0139_2-20121125/3857_1 /TAXON_ID=44445 /ORGANISM="Pseudo-nitzschia australis, Strain 10249 10 AB" /LENGTH=607 /DNA_ID=CAMNT_0008087295 /DNA_START=432 /DNA_END=2255 /DNA_ORIENTATION=+
MTAPNITTIDATTTVVVPSVPTPVPAEDVASDTDAMQQEMIAVETTEEEPETPEEREQRIVTLKLLARQLEYYFSEANLSRDTYLSTLRGLNDSYVPVSIIANFGKVQVLAPYESALEAVILAATDHSDLLEVVELDEEGNTVVDKTEEEKKDELCTGGGPTAIILAVGSISTKPIPMSQIQPMAVPIPMDIDATTNAQSAEAVKSQSASVASTGSSNGNVVQSTTTNNVVVQNTIILREVAEDVEEQTLRDLFDFEGYSCPSIESIREDLHNCWFVTLDTNSKDDIFNVMMKLRTAKFPSGDSVKARLKSSALVASTSPLTPNSVVFNPNLSTMYPPQFRSNSNGSNGNVNASNGGNNNSRKKRSSSNKGRSSNSPGGSTNANKPKSSNQQSMSGTSKRRNGKDESPSSGRPTLHGNAGVKVTTTSTNSKKKVMAKPPSMGESNFPSLPPTTDGSSKPWQVEKVPTDDEMMQGCEKERNAASGGFSDSSSTATSSTASTPTEAPPSGFVTGGYAAALLKPAALIVAPMTAKKAETKGVSQQQQPSDAEKGKEGSKRRENKKGKEEQIFTKSNNAPSSKSISSDPPAVSVQPPVWGKGRSFADIVSA